MTRVIGSFAIIINTKEALLVAAVIIDKENILVVELNHIYTLLLGTSETTCIKY